LRGRLAAARRNGLSLKYAILGLLSEGPRHGYELKALYDEALVPSAKLNFGQVYPTLDRLPPSPIDGDIRLTDCVHALLRSRNLVESHRIYDEGEVQGINTLEDLERAEFILQKRFFRPRRIEEESVIHFGTGGWRAVISEGFTMYNVRRLSQALANKIIRDGIEEQGVLIGYDRRFLSDRAAETSAEVFAGNNIPVTLVSEDAPTPLITYATDLKRTAYGLAFTASHNPPEYNGLKVFHTDGSLLLTEETLAIEREANALTRDDIVELDYSLAVESGIVHLEDFVARYVDSVESQVDMNAIRRAGLRVIVDPMYGVGEVALNMVLTEARCRVRVIHERRNPLFGGRSDMGSGKDIGMIDQCVIDGRFLFKNIKCGCPDFSGFQCSEQSRFIHDPSAGSVD